MERYFIMIVSVLVFYTIVKRNGFSKKLALAAGGFVGIILVTIAMNGLLSASILVDLVPYFFMAYCIFHFIVFCLRKSADSLRGMQELNTRRRKFKESQKVSDTNKNIKTYKGAKKKKD